jgi:hypothetical protein
MTDKKPQSLKDKLNFIMEKLVTLEKIETDIATMKQSMATQDDIERLNRKFEDLKTSTDTRFAEATMRAKMGDNVYTSIPRVHGGHAMSESSKEYRRIKSQGR